MEHPTTVRKPEGGFVFISVRQLCRAWVAYQQRLICLVDLWVWFAAQELVARRCQLKAGQSAHYRVEELTRLVGGTHSMPVSLRRLAMAGLLHWEETTLTFPDERAHRGETEALTTMLEQITNRHRLIPVPRRLLRYLAGGCPKVTVATILGHLMRCLYYRQGECRPQGHCKATWIANVFGVSVRQVKKSRHGLEDLGLLQRSTTVQWVLNRYGQTMTVNLQWAGARHDPHPQAGNPAQEQRVSVAADSRAVSLCASVQPEPERRAKASGPTLPTSPSVSLAAAVAAPLAAPVAAASAPGKSAPPPSPKTAQSAPPDSHSELSTRGEHQKPSCGGTPGFLIALFLEARTALREGQVPKTEERPVVLRSIPTSRTHVPSIQASFPISETLVKKGENSSAATPLPAPSLRHILVQDLRDTGRLLQLYEQARTAGLLGSSEADRLAFVTLAQHVLAYRPANAGGLFTHLLRKRHFNYATQDDEDSAQRRLNRHFYSGTPTGLQPIIETVLRRAG